MFQYYIAMGVGSDRKNYKMMDVTACHLKDSKLRSPDSPTDLFLLH